MFRKLALALLPIALLAAACGGGDSKSDQKASTEPTAVATEAVAKASPTAKAKPTVEAEATPTEEATADSGGGAASLLGSFNPLQLMSEAESMGALGGSADVDPSLKALLLTADDLPASYSSAGDFTYSVPSESGNMDMAMAMFIDGDMAGTTFNGMVMSAALVMPPAAMDQMGSLDELKNMTTADLQAEMDKASGTIEGMGVSFKDLKVLDASGLGDGGLGIHMAMDMSGMMDAFGGADAGAMPFEGGIFSYDMYMFFHGDKMLMVMVAWGGSGSAPENARDLADVMDAKAAE